ncbi:hypothetical protein [Streptomyces olivochromogenes]|uniref:Uncharacterized protein n=1 Tax=Streptomyces olivochromogenes TaxID=1963 RepID=A0A250VT23_STROL|nr:hypothetical protein [Streptomyces olivochromogenes]KUN38203.1 hypothetical protein AQJ27_44680 [Streptomyces olivochromogenes]GAX57363.1 hypothetical protein SO3561_08933 [Streptomyces olivochromogenes]
MPAKPQRSRLTEVTTDAQTVADALASRGDLLQAEAVQALIDSATKTADALDVALDAVSRIDLVPMAIPIESGLHMRAYESSNLTADVLEGWIRFLAGQWTPEKPTYARHGEAEAKSVMNIRAPRALVTRVEKAAADFVVEHEWPTIRGHKLNARHLATQWMARLYPAAPEGTEAAAE